MNKTPTQTSSIPTIDSPSTNYINHNNPASPHQTNTINRPRTTNLTQLITTPSDTQETDQIQFNPTNTLHTTPNQTNTIQTPPNLCHAHRLIQQRIRTPNLLSDDYFIGDELPTKPKTSIRLFYTNINGIKHHNQFESLHPVLHNMNNLDADIICFTEPNLDTSQPKIRLDLHKTIQRHCPQSKILSTTSRSHSNRHSNPGDVSPSSGTRSIAA